VVDNLGAQLEKVIRGANQGSKGTRYTYKGASERFIRFVGVNFKLKKLQNIQEKHLQAYAKDMKRRGCADKYIKKELSGIRYLHRQVPQARYNLLDSRESNKKCGLGSTPDGRADRTWTERELAKMKTLAMNENKPNIALALEIGRATGMRIDEFSSLRRAAVEAALRKGFLHLTNTKGGRPRDVPVSTRAENAFRAALKLNSRGSYLLVPVGMRVDQFKDKVEDFIGRTREGVQDPGRSRISYNLKPGEQGALTPHGLRHTFAREFLVERFKEKLEEGLDRDRAEKEARKETSQVMGHNRVSVTYIYAPEGLLKEVFPGG
jgi:site-specific recombinase XerD